MAHPRPHQGRNDLLFSHRVLLCIGTLLLPLAAHAIGLGSAAGNLVMGEPLAIEIPLTDPGAISIDCIQLSPIPHGSDSQYFPRRARIDLKKKADGALALLVQGPGFNQPVLEFRIDVTCGTQIARDYVMLLQPGRELRYEPVALAKPAVPPIADMRSSPHSRDSARDSAKPGPSIEQMAGSRYPNQPRARAKFKKQLREANPALQDIADDAPIPLNVELKFPAHPPKVRFGPYMLPPQKILPPPVTAPLPPPVAPPAAAAVPAPPPPKPAATQPVDEKPRDRLTISPSEGTPGATQPVGTANGALQAKAESSFSSQDEMTEKLAKTEASFNELKEQLLRMESRMAALEQERQRLQEENRKQTDWSILVGAVSILGGGFLGALLMLMLQHRRERRLDYDLPIFDIGNPGRE